ncbi:enoyl-CoA hydratase-related protein [Mumia qirimensis]|uniref:enoyl-CoA hydratase-related protein n=1 Tax=Mumia qirimensis TaxID=3234852 RepID=UPI00351D6D23
MTEPHAPVSYEVADGVATIALARPESLNAFDDATKVAFRDHLHDAAADDTVRCVVLTGSGRAFSAGQDLKELVAKRDSGAPLSNTVEEHYNPMVLAITTMPKPVIAAVNGIAAGAGASLAFAADFRIVAESAGFNLAFAGIALSADTGASWTLQRLVGFPKATELLLLPRTIRADEALQLGIATQVVPDDELADVVRELATRLAAGPTLAYASLKRALAYSATHSLPEALTNEGRLMALTGASEDHRAAVNAFLAKEKPTFVGR